MAEFDYITAAQGRYDDGGSARGDHLYFIFSDRGFCKIGRSAHVAKRLSQLQSGNTDKLHLHMWLPGMGWQERVWHAAFQHIRHQREWFRQAPALRHAINAARKGEEWIATLYHPRFQTEEAAYAWCEHIADLEEEANDAAPSLDCDEEALSSPSRLNGDAA